MDVARPLRNRLHVDVGVPHDLAPDRVAAVKEAGGREAFAADYYVTLADAEGNEVDVAPLTPESDLAEESESADWRVLFGAMAHYRTATYERAGAPCSATASTSAQTSPTSTTLGGSTHPCSSSACPRTTEPDARSATLWRATPFSERVVRRGERDNGHSALERLRPVLHELAVVGGPVANYSSDDGVARRYGRGGFRGDPDTD